MLFVHYILLEDRVDSGFLFAASLIKQFLQLIFFLTALTDWEGNEPSISPNHTDLSYFRIHAG